MADGVGQVGAVGVVVARVNQRVKQPDNEIKSQLFVVTEMRMVQLMARNSTRGFTLSKNFAK